MARRTGRKRTAKKTTVIDRLATNPQGTIINEASKAGIPKRLTKAMMGLTVIGAVAGARFSNEIAALPVVGKFAAIPLSWGHRIRSKLRF
tara:strand:+ start:53 stop:322 length:270 start_codon:yes stop_codon:yes gene_type:complete